MFKPAILVSIIAFVAAACSSSQPAGGMGDFVPLGLAPTTIMQNTQPQDYLLGPADKIAINVSQMPALSVEGMEVDATGRINLPQVGEVEVAGRTTAAVQQDLTNRLRECCLVNPYVMVRLVEPKSRQITVTGAVRTPNIYALPGRITLLQAIAMAGGPDQQVANTRVAAIYRNQNGQRVGAKFDLHAITEGRASDPEILAGDYIVLDTSDNKSNFRNMIQAIPVFGVFTAVL